MRNTRKGMTRSDGRSKENGKGNSVEGAMIKRDRSGDAKGFAMKTFDDG